MKLEASEDCPVAVCSKTYELRKFEDRCKISSKGLSKSALQNVVDVYKQVLNTQINNGANNTDIKLKNNTLVTYKEFGAVYAICISNAPVELTVSPLKLVLCHRRDLPKKSLWCGG